MEYPSNENLNNFLRNSYWLNFEITNMCNIPCYYCSNRYLKRKGRMSLQTFRSILDNLSHHGPISKEVIFCGYGEPFLNKDIYDMIDHIAEQGLPLTIQSNGKWQLNDARIESLYKVKRLSVTIDGVTNRVYNLSRPNTDVDLIFENLEKIVTLRVRDHQERPLLTAKMNVFSFNKHEIHDFIQRCMGLGIDEMNLAKGNGPADVMTSIDADEVNQYSHTRLSIDDNLIEERTDSRPKNIHRRTESAKSLAKCIRMSPENLFLKLSCIDTATIKWDGTLLPCCWDVDFSMPLGNLGNTAIEEILSSENLAEIGRKIVESRFKVYTEIPCYSCARFLNVFGPALATRARKLVPGKLKNLIREKFRHVD